MEIYEKAPYHYYWQIPQYLWIGESSEWMQTTPSLRFIDRIHNAKFILQPELVAVAVRCHFEYSQIFDARYMQVCLVRGLNF